MTFELSIRDVHFTVKSLKIKYGKHDNLTQYIIDKIDSVYKNDVQLIIES